MIATMVLMIAVNIDDLFVASAKMLEEASGQSQIFADITSYHTSETGAESSPILDVGGPLIQVQVRDEIKFHVMVFNASMCHLLFLSVDMTVMHFLQL